MEFSLFHLLRLNFATQTATQWSMKHIIIPVAWTHNPGRQFNYHFLLHNHSVGGTLQHDVLTYISKN